MENPQGSSVGEETNFDKIVVHDASPEAVKILICNVSNVAQDEAVIESKVPEDTGIINELFTNDMHKTSNGIEKNELFSIKKISNDSVLVINIDEKEASELSVADDTIKNLNDTKVAVKSDTQENISSMDKTLEVEPVDNTLPCTNETMVEEAVELENVQSVHKVSEIEPVDDASLTLNNDKVEKYVEQENISSENTASDIPPIEEILFGLKSHDDALYMQTCIGESEDNSFQNNSTIDEPSSFTTDTITSTDNEPLKGTVANQNNPLENPEVTGVSEEKNNEIKNNFEEQKELSSIEKQENENSNETLEKLKLESERNNVARDYKKRSTDRENTFSKISGMCWLKSQNGTTEGTLVPINNLKSSVTKLNKAVQDPDQHSEMELKTNLSQEHEVSKDLIGFDQSLNKSLNEEMKLNVVEKNSISNNDNTIGFFNPVQEKTETNPLKHEEKNATSLEKCIEESHSNKCEVSKDEIGSDKTLNEEIHLTEVKKNNVPIDDNKMGSFNPIPEKTETKPSKQEEMDLVQAQNLKIAEATERILTQQTQNQDFPKPIHGRAGTEDNTNTAIQSKEKQPNQYINSSNKLHDQEKSSQNYNIKRDSSIDKKQEQQKCPHQLQDNYRSRPSSRNQNDRRDEINYKNRDNNNTDRRDNYNYGRNDGNNGNSFKNQENYGRNDGNSGNNFKHQDNYSRNGGNNGNSYRAQDNYSRNDGNSFKNQDNYGRNDGNNGNSFKNQDNYGRNDGNSFKTQENYGRNDGNNYKNQDNYGRNDGNSGNSFKNQDSYGRNGGNTGNAGNTGNVYKNQENYGRNEGNSYKNQDNYSRNVGNSVNSGSSFKNQDNYSKNDGNTGNSFKSQGNFGRNDGSTGNNYKNQDNYGGNRGDKYKHDYNIQESNTKNQNYDRTETQRKNDSSNKNLKAPINNIPFFNPSQSLQHHDSGNSKNQDRSSFANKSSTTDNSNDNNSKNKKSNTDKEGDFKRRRSDAQRNDGNSKQGPNQPEKVNQSKTLQSNSNSSKLNTNSSASKTESMKKVSEIESKHFKKESNTSQSKHEDLHGSKVNSTNQNVSSSLKKNFSAPRQNMNDNMSHANQTKQVKFKDDVNTTAQRNGQNDQANKIKSTLKVDSSHTRELPTENKYFVENESMTKNIAGSQQTDVYHQLKSNEVTFTATNQGMKSDSTSTMYMQPDIPTSSCNSSNINNFGSHQSSSRSLSPDWESNKALCFNKFMNLADEYFALRQNSLDLAKKQALVQAQMFGLELNLRKLYDVFVPVSERTPELEKILSLPKFAPHGELLNLLNTRSILTVPTLPMTGYNAATTGSLFSSATMVPNVSFADNSFSSQNLPNMSVPNISSTFPHTARSLPNFNQTASFDSHKNVNLHEHEISNEELSLQQVLGMQYHRNSVSM
ncbi:hypothetical protein TKK_0018484 [Trichogramma kaykai]|uniref:Uncharacterized protein n=1 Tax=Trichogramma kaykai TaxID=54128 RepID=A0ABD2VYI4_9HYME